MITPSPIALPGIEQKTHTAFPSAYRPPDAAPAPVLPRTGRRLLLVDEGWAATPHVAAALSAAGCEVHAFTAAADDTKYVSRYFTRTTAPAVGSAGYLPALDRLVSGGQFDHVIALTDATLHALWRAPRSWESLDYPRAAPWQREVMRDKRLQWELAAQAGVRVPAIRMAPDVEAVRDAVRTLGLPVVVKGIAGAGGDAVHIAEREDEAVMHWGATGGSDRSFLQQYVDGPTYLVGGLFQDGEPLRLYAAEKTEMSPPRTGPSVRLRTVDDAELVAAALAVFRALRWSGLASADFIRDVEGRFYFLEVNPRPWSSIAAAEAAGVDLFTPLAQLLTGGTPAPQLACRAGTSSTLFPQHMQALAAGGTLWSLGRALADVSAWRAAPWHRPGLVLHLLRWPWWQWRRARGA